MKSIDFIDTTERNKNMKNKIFAYMRISTNKKTQKIDRQEKTILDYATNNNFKINEFYSDIISGGCSASTRPNYITLKNQLREGDIIILSDIDRLGRDADDVILELKELKLKGIRLIALDIPHMNEWNMVHDSSLYNMIIDIFITLRAHISQQEKEKIQSRIKQGLDVAKAKGKTLGRPTESIPTAFVRAYKKRNEGGYGNISTVEFTRLLGIGRSTYYKYITIIKEQGLV